MIKDSVYRIEQGSKLVVSNSKVLNEVLQSAELVRTLNSQIASASNEQSQGISQISRAMSEIDTAVNESAQSSQDANTQAESLSLQSETLNEIIHLFEKEIKGASDVPTSSQDQEVVNG
jgi:methyl-accepting chemotaxis protein